MLINCKNKKDNQGKIVGVVQFISKYKKTEYHPVAETTRALNLTVSHRIIMQD